MPVVTRGTWPMYWMSVQIYCYHDIIWHCRCWQG